MIDLSVVVLCYHSGKTIVPFFHELEELLKGLSVGYETILVANDFAKSKDDTIDIVKELAKEYPHVIPITKMKEGMMGWDMLQGMNACNGKYICVIDGDGQFPIKSVAEVYRTIVSSQSDIVKTYRNKRNDGNYRHLLSSVYNFIFNLLYPGLHSKDVNSKPKIMRRETYAALKLESTDWFIDAEIMIKVRKLKIKIEEIPIVFSANESRRSFVRVGAIVEFTWNLIKYKFKKY